MRTVFHILLTMTVLAFISSCEMESSHGGDLDGYWHLQRIETTQGHAADYQDKRVFWAIQGHLIQLTDRDYQHAFLVSRYVRQGDSLILEHPYIDDRNHGDPEITDPEILRFYGLLPVSSRYHIETLNSDRMSLSADTLSLHFRKL